MTFRDAIFSVQPAGDGGFEITANHAAALFYSKKPQELQCFQVHFQFYIVEIDTNLKPLVLISGNIGASKSLLGVSIDNVPIKGKETSKDDL